MPNEIVFPCELACEQAPKWGIGRTETSASRASGARYGARKKESEFDFCLHPRPYLGACSQATCEWLSLTSLASRGKVAMLRK